MRFTDGSEGVRDLSDVIAERGPMVEPLKSQISIASSSNWVRRGGRTGFYPDPINLYTELHDAGSLTVVAAE